MATDIQVGGVNLRASKYDAKVKGFAERMYKFKQAVTIASTNAFKNYFFRESPTPLTGQTGNAIRGIPRGANFPQAVAQWDRIMATIEQYGVEDNIYWIDIMTDDVDVQDRTLFRLAESVTKAVDDAIWEGLGGTGTLSAVTSFSIVGRAWDEASATIMDDLQRARMIIAQNNYDTTNLMAFVSPKDYRSIMSYLYEKGSQAPSIGEGIVNNGKMNNVAGIQFVMSNSVSASNCLVLVPKICGTWVEAQPLSTTTIEDKYKSVTIRVSEVGVVQLTDPNAVVRIFGTQASAN